MEEEKKKRRRSGAGVRRRGGNEKKKEQEEEHGDRGGDFLVHLLLKVSLCPTRVSVSSKQAASMCLSVPVLRVEEWPLPGDSLTSDTVRALIDRVGHLYLRHLGNQ